MKKHYLEEAGIRFEFCPSALSITSYIYDEIDNKVYLSNLGEMRKKYKALLREGYSAYDPNETIGSQPILKPTYEQELIQEAEEEAEKRQEFFRAKPDDWAFKWIGSTS